MKKLSGILAAVMLFATLFSGNVYAEQTFADVTNETPYQKAIIALSSYGIIQGSKEGDKQVFKPNDTITRAEYTIMLTRALAVADIKTDGASFTDIAEHYARPNIKTAADMGIVNGFEDNTFRPDEKVTYEQAVKMLVCALGYEPNAINAGGWPRGYLLQGGNLGITKGITLNGTDPAPRGVIAQLFYSALDVRIQVMGTNLSGETIYTTTDDTILNSKLKVASVKGTIIGVGETHTNNMATSHLNNEMSVLVKNKEMLFDYTNCIETLAEAKQYLGYDVTIYYKEETNSDLASIISIDRDTTKNEVITVLSTQIDEYDGSTLKYTDEKKSKNIKLSSSDVSLIYNDKTVSSDDTITINDSRYTVSEAVSEWLNPASDNFLYGDVTLTDTGADGSVDIVTINNYSIMVASKAATAADYQITDKLRSGNSVILDPDSTEYTSTVYKNGSLSSITSIAANDVVLYAASLDGENRVVYASSKPVTGSITTIDITDMLIEVDGKEYNLVQTCLDSLDGKTELKVGTKGTFYIDKYNNIVYCKLTEDKASAYAYILNTFQSDDGETYYASVYAPGSNSTPKNYQIRSNVRLNGSTSKPSSVVSKLKELAPSMQTDIENASEIYEGTADKVYASASAQPVKLDISSDMITSVTTLSADGQTNENNSSFARYKPLGNYKYTSSGNFSDEFYVNSSTTILYIPGDRADKEEYMKTTMSSYFKAGQSYWVEPYDVSDTKYAKLLLVYGNSANAQITKDSPFSFISKNIAAKSNGNDVRQLGYYTSDKTSVTTKYSSNDTDFADAEVGDVIQFGLNNRGYMINRKNIFKIKDIKAVFENGAFDWREGEFDYSFRDASGEIEIDSETQAPYSRAFMANVAEISIDEDEDYIVLTQSGIDDEGNLTEDVTERYVLPRSLKIIRFDGKNYSKNVENTTTALSAADLKDAKYHGKDCSKVLVVTSKRDIKYIVIYQL
jgi:hypothetical protein